MRRAPDPGETLKTEIPILRTMPVRTFIAIPVPGSRKILEFHERLSAIGKGKGLKPVAPENMHFTLRFLGDVEESRLPDVYDAVEEAAGDAEAFPLKIMGTGAFPKREYIKVIWLGVHEFAAGRMKEIAESLNNQLAQRGFGRDKFSAHLTIARVRFLKNRNAVHALMDEHADTVFDEYTVDSILVMKSDLTPTGPIYTMLKEIPLKKTDSGDPCMDTEDHGMEDVPPGMVH